eukprot:2206575-Rhodomonas_salina.2
MLCKCEQDFGCFEDRLGKLAKFHKEEWKWREQEVGRAERRGGGKALRLSLRGGSSTKGVTGAERTQEEEVASRVINHGISCSAFAMRRPALTSSCCFQVDDLFKVICASLCCVPSRFGCDVGN